MLLAALAAPACAAPQRRELGSPTDVGRPEAARFAPSDAFGRQIVVTTATTRMFAELVACDEGFVYLHLNSAGPDAWTMVPWLMIQRAEIPAPGSARVTNIVTLVVGSVSTLSHGIWGVVSVPVWAAAGVPSIVWAISHDHITGRCQDLDAYTRYPQGMPPVIFGRYWGRHAADPLPVAPLPP